MREKIGKVELIYDFDTGNDSYSDGDIEDILLKIAKENNVEKALYASREWPILYHFSSIRENIIDWYPIKKDETVLEIGAGCGAISGVLCKKAQKVVGIEISKRRSYINAYRNRECSNLEIYVGNFEHVTIKEKFDYVTLIGVLEYSGLYVHYDFPYEEMLKRAKEYLKPDGKIIIAIENKMGLKYLNGAYEDHTGKAYSGINDYRNIKNVRTFSKIELEKLMQNVGITEYQFYYPLPDYKLPIEIYSDEKIPEAGEIRYYHTNYDNNRFYLYNEAIVFDQICKDMKFDYFSNSFLIICNEKKKTIEYAKYNRERKSQYRIKTIIRNEENHKYVDKAALNAESMEHIKKMKENYFKIANLYDECEVLAGTLSNGLYSYPYLEGYNLDEELFQWRHDAFKFIQKAKELIEKYYKYNKNEAIDFEVTDNFRLVFGKEAPDKCVSLKVTNVDHMWHNIRISNGKAYVFDYEWVFEFPIPHDFIVWRNLYQLYGKYRMYLNGQITQKGFFEQFNFSEGINKIYRNMDICFEEYVIGKKRKEVYTSRYQKQSFSQEIRILP